MNVLQRNLLRLCNVEKKKGKIVEKRLQRARLQFEQLLASENHFCIYCSCSGALVLIRLRTFIFIIFVCYCYSNN